MAVVWQISAIQFNEKTLIRGYILKNISWPDHLRTTMIKNVYLVLGSYFRQRYKSKDIIVSVEEQQYKTKTDKFGKFSVTINRTNIKEIKILNKETNKPFEIIQSYPIFFPDNNNPVSAISDIDDTIIISNTRRVLKTIATTLFVAPRKRVPVNFASKILNALNNNGSRIFYVSKSESNLFALLTYFIKNRKLPVGYLHLTPYISAHQLVKTKGGKNYKEKAIRFILKNSNDKKFILLGDDTQHDMKIYHTITQSYPGKILRIYIHKTRSSLKGSKKSDMEKLLKLPVSTVYFTDSSDLTQELNYINNL